MDPGDTFHSLPTPESPPPRTASGDHPRKPTFPAEQLGAQFGAVPTLLHQPTAWGTGLAKHCLLSPLPGWSELSGHVGYNCEHQGQGEGGSGMRQA